MTAGDKIAIGLLKPMNPHGASLLGYMTFLWGIWIMSPWWDVFTRAGVYSRALGLAPEWAWGSWAAVCGLGVILSTYRRNTVWLARTAGFAVWHWGTVSTMFWWGDWQNTAGLTYMFICFYAIFVFLNIRVNYVKQGIHKF